ncbi:N-acetylmuramoyl-L-alanine amidase [Lentibacillus salicampi]|nr:N-acetylmuramoyl-L-alanine amidase [Lentibacillus salicampi]
MGKIRLLISAIVFILTLIVFSSNVLANDGDTYKVGTDVLNVRSSPSHSADVVGHLAGGDQAVVFQEKNGWAQTYYNGQIAWVASQYLYSVDRDAAVQNSSSAGNDHAVETESVSTEGSGTLDGITIVLDPGHGGKDPGAIGLRGTMEKSHTLSTADRVAQGLLEAGANVMLTRSDDTYVSLENRVNHSNVHATDAFISLHYNAFPLEAVNGFSTYYYTDGNDYQLAGDIQTGLEQHMDLNSRGLMKNGYHVLRKNSDLSVLVELGFITNPYDLSVIQTAQHKANVADGIVAGLVSYFNK